MSIIIKLIPPGKVDNNLGPDHLAGSKALDPNYCRQLTISLHDLCLENFACMEMSYACFSQGIPLTHTIDVAHLTL